MSKAISSFDPLELLTVREAAARLHVSRPTVEKYMKLGELPSILIGRCRRIRRVDLEAFIERRLTCDYSPMNNRHRGEGQRAPLEGDCLTDPVFQDGGEGNIPF